MQIISLWSGPRNVSTALMYSFARRPDTKVVDEPLYGHYLRISERDHPGRDEVLRAMEHDGDAIMRQLLGTDFFPAMLHWPAGPIAEDGIWAKHWYSSVHKSTGFATYVAKNHFPANPEPLLDECKPYYDKLYAQAIKARPTRNHPS